MRASHILITAPKDASAADKAKAKQKADELLAQIKAHPDQFAQIAQQNSQGSRLGVEGRRSRLLRPRHDRRRSRRSTTRCSRSKKDEVSGIVQTDFGYHIVKVTDVKPAAYQAVRRSERPDRERPEDATRQQGIQRRLRKVSRRSSMRRQRACNRPPTSTSLQLQTATVTPQPDPKLPPDSPLNNAKFLAAAVRERRGQWHATTRRQSTSAHNTLIAARVTDYMAAAAPPAGRSTRSWTPVRQKVIAAQSNEAAHKDGIAKLAEFEKSKATTGFSSPLKVSRNDAQGVRSGGARARSTRRTRKAARLRGR